MTLSFPFCPTSEHFTTAVGYFQIPTDNPQFLCGELKNLRSVTILVLKHTSFLKACHSGEQECYWLPWIESQ